MNFVSSGQDPNRKVVSRLLAALGLPTYTPTFRELYRPFCKGLNLEICKYRAVKSVGKWCLLFVDVDGSCYLVDEILSLSELNLGYVDAVCGSILEGQLLMSTFSILDIWRFGGMLTSALPWETRSAKIHFFWNMPDPSAI